MAYKPSVVAVKQGCHGSLYRPYIIVMVCGHTELDTGENRRASFSARKSIYDVVKEESERLGKIEELVDLIDPFSDSDLNHTSKFITNARAMSLYSQRWVPKNNDIKALVFWCHGYADNSSHLSAVECARLAKHGFAIFSMDYEGHGRSDGLQVMLEDFETIVDDVQKFAADVKKEFPHIEKSFLWGESMGGAVAIKLSLREPECWDGMMLMAPMCKIADEMKPPEFVISILTYVAHVFPTWKAAPVPDVLSKCFARPEVYASSLQNPTLYSGKPRLQTAVQMLKASNEIEADLHKVSLPFLILHGEKDVVTDPKVSEALYNRASCSDKTFVSVEGAWHSLLWDQLPVRTKARQSLLEWILPRCEPSSAQGEEGGGEEEGEEGGGEEEGGEGGGEEEGGGGE